MAPNKPHRHAPSPPRWISIGHQPSGRWAQGQPSPIAFHSTGLGRVTSIVAVNSILIDYFGSLVITKANPPWRIFQTLTCSLSLISCQVHWTELTFCPLKKASGRACHFYLRRRVYPVFTKMKCLPSVSGRKTQIREKQSSRWQSGIRAGMSLWGEEEGDEGVGERNGNWQATNTEKSEQG